MPQKRKTLATALGFTLLLPLAACGQGTEGSDGTTVVEALKLTAVQAISKASEKTAGSDTFKATISVDGPAKIEATTQTQIKPVFLQSMEYKTVSLGTAVPGAADAGGMKGVITADAMYLNMPQLTQLSGGKPWIKWKLDGKDGLGLGDLLKQSQQYSPAEQTKMLTSSPDVKQIGQEDVGGIPTTHYAGTMKATDALAKLDPEARDKLKDVYTAGGVDTVAFDLWLGTADQLPYKLVSKVATSEGPVATTMTFSDYGKPVSIQIPPADQVGDFKFPS